MDLRSAARKRAVREGVGTDPGGRVPAADDRWSLIFWTRHVAVVALAAAAAFVPGLDGDGTAIALLLLGLVLPWDIWLHRRAIGAGRIPEAAAYVDQLLAAGMALAFPAVWTPTLLVALADLGLMTLLFGRRTAAGSALLGVQAFAGTAIAVRPAGAALELAAFLITAPTLIVTTGTVADLERRLRVRYSELVEGLDTVIWEADPTTLRLRYVSPTVTDLLGYPLQDWYEHRNQWLHSLHPDDRERTVSAYLQAILDGHDHRLVYRMIAVDGRVVWIQDAMKVEFDAQGQPAVVRGELVDISERMEAAREIRRYADIVENMQLGLQVWRMEDPTDDRSFRLVSLNPAAAELTATTPLSVGERIDEILPGLRVRGLPAMAAEIVRTGAGCQLDDVIYGDEPRTARRFSVKLFPLPDRCVGVAFEDVTERKRAQRELAERARQWAALADLGRHAVEGMELPELFEAAVDLLARALDVDLVAAFETIPDQDMIYLRAGRGWNEAGLAIRTVPLGTGSEVDLVLGRSEALVVDHLPSESRFTPSLLLRTHQPHSGISVAIPTDRFRYGVLSVYDQRPRTFTTQDVHFLEAIATVLAEAIERKRAEEALRHEALHDSLTGLANRTLLYDRLEHAIASARRLEHPVALLLMDVDRFKEVNDTLGHHCGDLLLRGIGERLEGLLRESDTIARLGGDEFAIVLSDIDDPGYAVMVAARIQEALSTPFVIDGVAIGTSATIGIAIYPDHGYDSEALLQRADVAMYAAKPTRNGYAIYSPDHGPHTAGRLELLSDLRWAIERNELVLHYQPQVDLRRGQVDRVEALVRWEHPVYGLLPPGRFIQLAETSGLIHELTERVIDLAVGQCRAWMDRGFDLGVAVNVSVHDLYDERIVAALRSALADHAVPGDRLTLEITESDIMEDPQKAVAILDMLASMGIRLSVDDFGTGYSSLAYLKRLPIHEIKIDRTFIADMGTDANDAAIVRSIVDLSRHLGLRVVAEGVESREIWDTVAELTRCDVAQGYHIARPLPPRDVEEWLVTSAWPVPRREVPAAVRQRRAQSATGAPSSAAER